MKELQTLRRQVKFFNIFEGSGGDEFSIPFLILEDFANKNLDIIVIKGEEQMWLTPAEYWIFTDYESIDDGFYINCKFKFRADKKTFSDMEMKILSKFHHQYLNNEAFYNYIMSPLFLKVLEEVAIARKSNNVIPNKESMLDGYKNINYSPDYITLKNDVPMNCWNKLITLTKECHGK